MLRCTTMLSTDPSYDNRTLAKHPQNTNPDGLTLEGTAQRIGRTFGVVSIEGHNMPLHIFEVGLQVNTKVYLDVLKSVVIPWSNQITGGRPWV